MVMAAMAASLIMNWQNQSQKLIETPATTATMFFQRDNRGTTVVVMAPPLLHARRVRL
jgi:hypothetical protein